MKIGSLCTGYGGIELGLALAGESIELAFIAEIGPAAKVYDGSDVPNLGDITALDWAAVAAQYPVDLLAAGFPCQPVSAAGRQLAEADERWLWPNVRDAIRALMPSRVLLENVRNLVSMRKGELWRGILDDLTGLGYDVRWLTLGACAVGAAHHRHRVFALATWSPQRSDRSGTVTRLDVAECGAKGRVMVPTTTRTDSKDSRNATARRPPGREHHNGSTTLGDFARIVGDLLPTPAASRYGSNQGGAAGRVGPVRHSLGSLARLDLLPTPIARDADARGQGNADYWAGRHERKGSRTGIGLGAELAMLPTPTRSEGVSGPGYAASAQGTPNLRTAVTLLPTPRASGGVNGGPGQRGSSGDLAMPSAVQPADWGRFADAVARHAALYGDPPAPTEPNRNGAPRLSAAFAEWLMCIPAGHVTQALPLRREALAAIGNGVCPPQLAAAWLLLTGQAAPVLDMSLGQSVPSPTMTTTSEQVADLDARQADARARVVGATMALGVTVDPKLLASAMLELVTIWREQADWWEGSTRRGRQGKAKSLRDAAAELAGFAGGLSSAATPESGLMPEATAPTPDQCPHPGDALSRLKTGGSYCTLCGHTFEAPQQPLTADNFVPVVEAAHHQGDVPMQPMPAPVSASPFTAPVSVDNDGAGLFAPFVAGTPLRIDAAIESESPFAAPAAPGRNRPPVTRLGFGDLGKLIADTYPVARSRLSHSFVEDMEACGLKALLSDASRHEVIGPRRPSWSLIGGIAFHNVIEQIERAAIALGGASPTGELGEWSDVWTKALEAVIDETNLTLAGSAYADPSSWHVANKGLENFDWWRVKGVDMVTQYVKVHDDAWRATHTLLQVPTQPNADTGEQGGVLTPVLEFAFDNTIGGTAIGSAGRIDAAWVAHPVNGQLSQYPTAALEVVDFKSGARDPQSVFQMAEYADILRRHYLPANFALPIYGRHYLARKGIYTPPTLLDPQATTPEIAYRYTMAERGMRNGTFMANPSSFCSGCGLVDYCPTQRHRDA